MFSQAYINSRGTYEPNIKSVDFLTHCQYSVGRVRSMKGLRRTLVVLLVFTDLPIQSNCETTFFRKINPVSASSFASSIINVSRILRYAVSLVNVLSNQASGFTADQQANVPEHVPNFKDARLFSSHCQSSAPEPRRLDRTISDASPSSAPQGKANRQTYEGANARLLRTQSAGSGAPPPSSSSSSSSSFNGHCDRTAGNARSREDEELVITPAEMAKLFPKQKEPGDLNEFLYQSY